LVSKEENGHEYGETPLTPPRLHHEESRRGNSVNTHYMGSASYVGEKIDGFIHPPRSNKKASAIFVVNILSTFDACITNRSLIKCVLKFFMADAPNVELLFF
jgi:hypothetical protein